MKMDPTVRHKTRSAWAADRGACQCGRTFCWGFRKANCLLHQIRDDVSPRYSTPGKSVKRIQLKSPQGASSREWAPNSLINSLKRERKRSVRPTVSRGRTGFRVAPGVPGIDRVKIFSASELAIVPHVSGTIRTFHYKMADRSKKLRTFYVTDHAYASGDLVSSLQGTPCSRKAPYRTKSARLARWVS